MTNRNPIRLPPLARLRVRNPNRIEPNPCINVMASVLTCWASAGQNSSGCAAVEQALRACMDGPKPPPKPQNTINFHLARFANSLTGRKPGKK